MQPELTAADIPSPVVNEGCIDELKSQGLSFTDDPHDRLFRAHGNYGNWIVLLGYNIYIYCGVGANTEISILFQVTPYMNCLFWGRAGSIAFQIWLCGQVSTVIVEFCLYMMASLRIIICILFFSRMFHFPASHDDVCKIVQTACKHNCVIIPFGGELDCFNLKWSKNCFVAFTCFGSCC